MDEQSAVAESSSVDVSIRDADLDAKKGLVWSTYNKVVSTSVIDFVCRILESQGYAANLENTLACLETVEFSPIVRTGESGDKYNHGVSFLLPKKTRHGALIRKLYNELEKYGQGKNQSATLIKKVEKLEREVERLSASETKSEEKVQELKTKLSLGTGEAGSSSTSKSSSSGDIRFCTLQNFNFEKRTMDLKMNRKKLSISMAMLAGSTFFPSEGQGCIAVFDKDKVHALTPLPNRKQQAERSMSSMTARVLFSGGDEIRIRDDMRRLLTVKAYSISEKELFQNLRRGDSLQVFHFNGEILWLDLLSNQNGKKFKDFVQKKLLERSIEEGHKPDEVEHNKTEKRYALVARSSLRLRPRLGLKNRRDCFSGPKHHRIDPCMYCGFIVYSLRAPF